MVTRLQGSIPGNSDTLSYFPETHPASYEIGTGRVSTGKIDRGMMLTTHLPSSADVKNEWSYNSTPPRMPSRRGKGPLYLFLNIYFHLTTLLSSAGHMALYNKYDAHTQPHTTFREAAVLISANVLLQLCR